jgi:hypothetical protein
VCVSVTYMAVASRPVRHWAASREWLKRNLIIINTTQVDGIELGARITCLGANTEGLPNKRHRGAAAASAEAPHVAETPGKATAGKGKDAKPKKKAQVIYNIILYCS